MGCQPVLLTMPRQMREPQNPENDSIKTQALQTELEKLCDKEAIELAPIDPRPFISPMFVVPKTDGSWRPVINLQALNTHISSPHFKMESIRVAKDLIQRDDWMVKLDLKDAYLSVPLHHSCRNLFAFHWNRQVWRFKTLPFGVNSAPYIFTKLTKPVVSLLRHLGIRLILYLDDLLIMGNGIEQTRRWLATSLEVLTALGFIVNLKKSVTTPTQTMEFLGFVLNSTQMTISLPQPKLKALRQTVARLLSHKEGSVRQIAQLLGTMVAAHPAILPAPLFYRKLERAKSNALREGLGYDSVIQINQGMEHDLSWWFNQSHLFNGRPLQIPHWDLVIETDASTTGWGAYCKDVSTGGPWTTQERQHHINFLELLAVFLAIKSFASKLWKANVLLRVDNVTAIAFINRMGGPTPRSYPI